MEITYFVCKAEFLSRYTYIHAHVLCATRTVTKLDGTVTKFVKRDTVIFDSFSVAIGLANK